MTTAAQELLEAALRLSEAEREYLVEGLLESLPPPEGFKEVTEEELRAELERRMADFTEGRDPGVPWSEVKLMLPDSPP